MATMKINGKFTFVEEKNRDNKTVQYLIPHAVDKRIYCTPHTDYVIDTDKPVAGTVYDGRVVCDLSVGTGGSIFMNCVVAILD